MFSAYTNEEKNRIVLLAVNLTHEARAVTLALKNAPGKSIKNQSLYLTNEFSNLTKQEVGLSSGNLVVPARSVVTYTADLSDGTSDLQKLNDSGFKAYLNRQNNEIVASFGPEQLFQTIGLYSISGKLIQVKKVKIGQNRVVFPVSRLSKGVYLVSVMGKNFKETKKVIITN
jgi:hypothetical protein